MFAALHIPDLTVIAALKASPGDRGKPCAILNADVDVESSLEKMKLPLQAVNDIARGAGIGPGWPLNRALVRCPGLKILPPHTENEGILLGELIALGESLTPDLEVASKDTLLLDLSRTSSRHAARLAHAEIEGVELHHARAATPDLAGLAVRDEASYGRFISSVEIAGLPLELLKWLPGGSEFLPLLDDWGLKTLGCLMALPRQSLTQRLGPIAGRWHDLLHAKTCRMLRLHRPPESLEQTMDFEEAVTSTEQLIFAFKRLLHALHARLMARHVAVKELRILFHLEGGARLLRILRLPDPRVEESELLRPVQVLLDSLQTGSGVIGIVVDVEATTPGAAQKDWFIRQLPRPERWTDTLAQLDALLGPGKTGIPMPPASHSPDDFGLQNAQGNLTMEKSIFQPSTSLPLRRFRPPCQVAVAFDAGKKLPRPLAVLTGPYRGEIVEYRGPFGTSGHWWDPQAEWKRLEWDICLTNRHLLRLAFSPPDLWEVDGLYI